MTALLTSRPRVLVSRRWPAAVEARLAELFEVEQPTNDVPLTPADFRDALGRVDAILPTVTDALGAWALDHPAPRTRILANYGVGYSHIDTRRAAALGITVTNTPDVLSDCTADIAMTLMLMVMRRAGEGERELRAGSWSGWRPTHMIGAKVSGKTLGIIGFGRIGQEMARRAHFGFGLRIVVQSRSAIAPEILNRYGATQVTDIDTLLERVDVVSLHCPGGAANRHLLNADRLARLPAGAFVINTARGEVIDEDALAQALQTGHLGGAGLDVFDGEPHVNPALLAAPNLVMLPHLGSATAETRTAMGLRVVDNLRDFFSGHRPRDKVA